MSTGRLLLVMQEGSDPDSYIAGFLAGAMMIGGMVPEKFEQTPLTDEDIQNIRRDPTCNLHEQNGEWFHKRPCQTSPDKIHYDKIGAFNVLFRPAVAQPLPSEEAPANPFRKDKGVVH